MASKKVLSIAMDGDFQDKLKNLADAKKTSVSMLIRETLEKYLFAEKGTVKLVINIPKDVTSDEAQLANWLSLKCNAIVNHFKS